MGRLGLFAFRLLVGGFSRHEESMRGNLTVKNGVRDCQQDEIGNLSVGVSLRWVMFVRGVVQLPRTPFTQLTGCPRKSNYRIADHPEAIVLVDVR